MECDKDKVDEFVLALLTLTMFEDRRGLQHANAVELAAAKQHAVEACELPGGRGDARRSRD